MTIQEKLEMFERYIRRTRFSYSEAKANMIWRFHDLFIKEMRGTQTGTKFRKKIGVKI